MAKVTVNHQDIAEIDVGIMALLAVEKDDTSKEVERLLERILSFRIFADVRIKNCRSAINQSV